MFRVPTLALLGGLIVLSGGLVGQEAKKEDPKTTTKKEDPKGTTTKKEDPAAKFKGQLPANYKKLGLTDEQVQSVYKIQGKYATELGQLRAKEDELKATRDKEVKGVLTPEQKKRLDDILTGKDK